MLVGILVASFVPLLLVTPVAQANSDSSSNWWNTSWSRRRPIAITGSHPENYQLKIVISYDSDMRSDYGDLRFLENDNTGVLNYWIENYTADNATVWVKRVENVDSTIYMYYGNPSASSADNWENTILPYTDSQATDNASWSARKRHTSVVFDDKIWVIGGRDNNNNLKNDVWCSSDGTTWIQVTDNASWAAREHHTSVVFDDKMWVIGGWAGAGSYENDVWYSSDGENWFQATEAAGWAGREAHASVVFDNKMWVMGGIVPPVGNDVWYSSDGENWFQATDAAGWDAREAPISIVFDNKMWIIGGYTNKFRNDVWYSSDGENWFQATDAAGWAGREFHESIVFDNKMWVMGGVISATPLTRANDVWYSSDGENWFQATDAAGWTARYDQSSVVFDDKMWVMGGNIGGASASKNDVWRLLRSYVSPEPTVSVGSEEPRPNSPDNLMVENQVSPQRLTTFTPEFSFRYTDNDNANSSMVHIQVGTSASDNSMWDNQQVENVENGATISIIYAGTALQRDIQYYWRVRVRDNENSWSYWSDNENFRLNRLPVAENQKTDGQVNPTGLMTFTPTFSWDYSDNDNDAQSNYQVQVGVSENDNSMWDNTGAALTQITYSGSALARGATYHVRVRAKDNYEWSSWINGTFALNNSPTVTVGSSTIELGLVDVGDAPVISTPTLTIKLSIKARADDLLIYYARIDELPSIPNAGTIPFYFNISTNNPDAIGDVTLTFNIPKSWVAANDIISSTLVAWKNSNGVWQTLPSRLVSEDALYYYLEATTHGFSLFSASGQIRVVAQTKNHPSSSQIPVSEQQTQVIFIVALGIFMISVMFLVSNFKRHK